MDTQSTVDRSAAGVVYLQAPMSLKLRDKFVIIFFLPSISLLRHIVSRFWKSMELFFLYPIGGEMNR